MEYRCFGDTYVVRLERGEEIISALTRLTEAELLDLATVRGIGAADQLTVGVYDVEEKQYFQEELRGAFEITALTGNITRMAGKPYLHLHITVADPRRGLVAGGHLNRAVISATAELFITAYRGKVGRRHDEEIGLNLLEF